MHRYKRLMAGLNLSDQDEATIRYATMFCRLAKPEAVHFVHIVPRLNIPMSIRLKYPNMFRTVLNQMERVIQRHWEAGKEVAFAYEVDEGAPLTELIYQASTHASDLILVGNRKEQRKNGALPERLALEAACPVMVIPEGVKPKLTKTFVVTASSKISASDPAAALQKRARDQHADLVAIDARKPSSAALLATVIKRVVQTIDMPLLVWKAGDFDTPARRVDVIGKTRCGMRPPVSRPSVNVSK